MYCRFCFRRERVGPGSGALSTAEFAAALDYLRAHEGIWEVILTGGDPLTLSPRRIAETTQALAAIPHVKVLRWHTRVPIAAPQRVTKAMARALVAEGKTTVVAVHANHPRELTDDARSACRRLAAEGAMLVSQSVLLKGVNDDADTLIDLMRAFVEARVKPYYLHHGDLAPGTTHWRVSIAKGQDLMRLLRARLSGLATPTYMLDIPGGHGKAPIGPQWIDGENGEHVVTDPRGTSTPTRIGWARTSTGSPNLSGPGRLSAEPSRANELQQRRIVAFGDALRHGARDNGIEEDEPSPVGDQCGQQQECLKGAPDGRHVWVGGVELGRILETAHGQSPLKGNTCGDSLTIPRRRYCGMPRSTVAP